MTAADASKAELVELRRCVRDLAALAALPVVWSASDSRRVVESLAEALLGMLRLDFIYIRFRGCGTAGQVEVGRLAGRPSAALESGLLGELLSPWLDGSRSPTALPRLPVCGDSLCGFVVPFGLDGASGLIASGSARAGFPSETEQLLLRVAANQAAVILARQRGEAARERLLLEVDAERKRLSEVFERAPAFMCLLSGPDHVFTLANEHYRQLVGGRDVHGRPVREALPEVVGQGFVALLDQVFRTGEAFAGHDVLVKLRRGPGGELEDAYLDFTYQAMRGSDGAVTGILVQGIDLTQRKRAQAELRAKDARLQLLMDNVKDYAVVITDAAGIVVEWAGGAKRITGFAPGEALGQSIDLIFTQDDIAAGQPARERSDAQASGQAEDARWHVRKDGGRFFGEGLTSPLYDEFGRLHGFGKIFKDGTAQWQARQDLARVAQASLAMNAVLSVESISKVLTEEARAIIGAHQAVTSLTPGEDWMQAISTVSLSDQYPRYPGFDAITMGQGIYAEVCKTNAPMRLTQEELLGHPAWRAFSDQAAGRPAVRGLLAVPLVGHGRRNLGLVQLSDKLEGEFSEEDEAILVQLAATAAVGIENARLYDSLKEQDRRKDEFLAMLAHELRNPLAPVRSGLDVLRGAGSQDRVAVETREMMGRQIGHMVRLIDDLMDVSRISRGKLALKLETVRLRDVVDVAVEASKPLIEARRHVLDLDMPDEVVWVKADLTRLAQVLGNLLNNAAKYTPDGGRIVLSMRCEGGHALIRVQDNGVGIGADMLAKVFELFTQEGGSIERAQGGLGIGLALARRLVELHGGTLEAYSLGHGQGSTFTLRLEAAASASGGASDEPGAAQPQPATGSLRVLVVDDNRDAADTFGLILGMFGHETRIAHSGPEALQAASEFLPQAVFLDIGLPGMSGYDVARQLRAQPCTSAATIVALTGWGSETDRERARQAGFDHHLTKPVELSVAQSILQEVALKLAGAVSLA